MSSHLPVAAGVAAAVALLVLAVPVSGQSAPTAHHPDFETGTPQGMGSRLWPGDDVRVPITAAVDCGEAVTGDPPSSVRFEVQRPAPGVAARFHPAVVDDDGPCSVGLDAVKRFSTDLLFRASEEVLGRDVVEIRIAAHVTRAGAGEQGPFAHVIEFPVAQVSVLEIRPDVHAIEGRPGQVQDVLVHVSNQVMYRETCVSFDVTQTEVPSPLQVVLPQSECLAAATHVPEAAQRGMQLSVRVPFDARPGQVIDFDLRVHARSPVGCSPVESCQVYPVHFTVQAMETEPPPAWTQAHVAAAGVWLSGLAAAGAGAWVAVRRASLVRIEGAQAFHRRKG